MARPHPQLIQDVDWTVDPYLYKPLEGYSSVMAIPLAGEHLPMSWALLLATPQQRFTEKDLEEAVERATLIGALLENQLLAEELARAHARIDADAKQLGDLQRALLPPSPPRIAGLDIATSYQTSGRAGGDLYDFFPLDPLPGDATATNGHAQRWCVLIGDAAGHGLAAAVMVAIVQAVLRAHPPRMDSPASLLTHANRQLCEKRIGGFFTGFLGIYESAARRLTYANAGHPAPLLRRPSENLIRPFDAVLSYPLGIDENECFQEAIVQLAPGDTVLFYTDGITEARSRDEERSELDRVTQILREAGDRPVDLIDQLCAAVRTHESGRSALDDQTLVAARVL
jgi:sigma-B regulation protein RsbU (phosphoserine phosphatase)